MTEHSSPSVERRLAAIMFTDIVGYTAVMARDEEAGRRARDWRADLVAALASVGPGPRSPLERRSGAESALSLGRGQKGAEGRRRASWT
jgi:hypothetical protein